MISNNCKYKKVHIQITTYSNPPSKQPMERNINHEKDTAKHCVRPDGSTKFICSICLNTKPKYDEVVKPECNRRKSKSCPICQKGFDIRLEATSENQIIRDTCEIKEKSAMIPPNQLALSTKSVQTSETDVSKGLNLLNEVLTVFQSKKQVCIEREKCPKTVIVKDASVETESVSSKKFIQTKLGISKVFFMSIEENAVSANNKFTVVHYSQPRRNANSHHSIDLIKHKSSSIPQMKLEELKYSLKEKTKSKDAIEEVNRMFATVRRNAFLETLEDTNRPLIRNGPRVLPVVKATNKVYYNDGGNTVCHFDDSNTEKKTTNASKCKFCQTNNYLMSSGDSIAKTLCCQQKISEKTTCIHAIRCHKCCLHNHNLCEHYCQRLIDNRCQPGRRDDDHNEDSSPSF